jgi:MIP family channel proteins
MRNELSRALVAEFIGTFALIFVGAGTGALGIGGPVGLALAHGLVLAGLAYAFGHISGTHINPAVTIGVWLTGKIHAGKALSYIVFQLLGGIAGALTLRFVLGGTETGLGATTLARNLQVGGATIHVDPMTGLLIEAILTFFLVNAVLNAGVSGRAGQNAGLAIGFTLAFCTLMGGPLTGAGLNPARTLGPALALGEFPDLWVYLAGPVLGGVVAAGLYRGALKD